MDDSFFFLIVYQSQGSGDTLVGFVLIGFRESVETPVCFNLTLTSR